MVADTTRNFLFGRLTPHDVIVMHTLSKEQQDVINTLGARRAQIK